MGKAMALAVSKGADCDEYKIACKLQSEGRLFEKFNAKKNADLAETLLQARFSDLLGDEVDAEIEAARDFTMQELQQLEELHDAPTEGAEPESIWNDVEYQEVLPTLQMQGTQHEQRLFLSDETQRVNSSQKKQKKK
jgi:hypothetical protein